ncbi:unannotated protein [freshwater metagenome]|uniref:Unannotated protein n=1 Tax=freshwater metagenome TaxID=449393 RepID=A0A6J7XXN8_9ZZZZ
MRPSLEIVTKYASGVGANVDAGTPLTVAIRDAVKVAPESSEKYTAYSVA